MTDVLNTPERRVEGRAKVTGAAKYAADFTREGMLHAAFVGSPYAHALVKRIDVGAARAVPGVRAVITGADVRPARFGRRLQDWPVLAWDRVRFIGDRVAAIAADTLEAAEDAARVVEVEYEELPAVFDPESALAADAPILHPDAAEETYIGGSRPARSHPNVQGEALHEHGDLAAGFARAAHVFEHEFRTPPVHQAYIEPRASLVWLEGDTVHVVTTNKAPFSLREQLALTVGMPTDKIVVHTPHVGGDFGGKGLSLDEHALVFLARATGRPVRSVLRYADELQLSNTRHGAVMRMRTGFDREGRITAHEARVLFDGGAYAAGKPVAFLMPGDAMLTLAGYHVPAARVDVATVYTNHLIGGHDRAPGQPQNTFAGESHLDLAAKAMGIDPLELRERNAIHAGQIDVEGNEWHESEAPRVLSTLRSEARWDARAPAGRGRGVALGVRHVGRGTTSMRLTLESDESVVVRTGVTDQGAGAHTMIQRVVARELGIPAERVRVEQLDTATSLRDPGVGGSRVTPVHGNAAIDGCRKLRAARDAGETPPITVTGTAEQNKHVFGTYAYAVEVEVDRETGAYRVTDAALVADVGTVINPVAVRGQLEGGFAFGFGQAVMEELILQDGRVTTANLGDYKIPTIADVPPLRLTLLTSATGPGPFGAKSVGELANPAVPAAIANAIADAVGARVMTLPITPDKVLDALRQRPA
ncbi:MAG TPA: xanthine dehydrogenase family protein molybdopterin-binding subunit [Candidatus Limnocylindria bacterium]|nr:xanthine dehydrogenase family protein molybdopterin-binding subunit [Candidatus Limnocylindria bacterium]